MGSHALEAAPALIGLLNDPNTEIRYKTTWALGAIGSKIAVEPLIEVLKDKTYGVRTGAADALKQLTGQKFGSDYKKWKKWLEEKKK